MSAHQAFDDFVRRYEASVPDVDPSITGDFIKRHAPWSEIVEEVELLAVHGFLIYWKSEVTQVMQLAGVSEPCKSYLMGNHTIAQRMFKHDATVMLHAPLRVLICADVANRTRFVIDQPSTLFDSFGNDAIERIGVELDRKLAALLEHLGISAPSTLTVSR